MLDVLLFYFPHSHRLTSLKTYFISIVVISKWVSDELLASCLVYASLLKPEAVSLSWCVPPEGTPLTWHAPPDFSDHFHHSAFRVIPACINLWSMEQVGTALLHHTTRTVFISMFLCIKQSLFLNSWVFICNKTTYFSHWVEQQRRAV